MLPCSVTDWSKAEAATILNRHLTLNALLSGVHFPSVLQTEPDCDLHYCKDIDEYYSAVMGCVEQSMSGLLIF